MELREKMLKALQEERKREAVDNNPLHTFWRKYNRHSLFMHDTLCSSSGVKYCEELGRTAYQHEIRRYATSTWAWGVPTKGSLSLIADYEPLVEFQAGTGYWAKLLQDMGVDIIPIDDLSWHSEEGEMEYDWLPDKTRFHKDRLYTDIIQGGVEEVLKHTDRTLLSVWPVMDIHVKSSVCPLYEATKGLAWKTIIFIGEENGCNACGAFFDLMDEKYTQVRGMSVPQWDGLHDSLIVWERK